MQTHDETRAKQAGSDNEWSVSYADSVASVSLVDGAAEPVAAEARGAGSYHACVVCGRQFVPKRIRNGRYPRSCSRHCGNVYAGRVVADRYPQQGSGNFNFKNWASKRPAVYVAKFKHENPEKLAAQRKLASAIRAGLIVRPSACEDCGKACKPDGHHSDYSKPLSVTFVCRRCHVRHDRERRAKTASASSRLADTSASRSVATCA